jgi:hypothetical protein
MKYLILILLSLTCSIAMALSKPTFKKLCEHKQISIYHEFFDNCIEPMGNLTGQRLRECDMNAYIYSQMEYKNCMKDKK